MKLTLTPISSAWFTYNQSSQTFSTEISSLRPFNPMARMYDDAMDVGFLMRSSITGSEVEYVLTNEHKDRDNDVTHWEFHPSWESERKVPVCKGTSVKIFND